MAKAFLHPQLANDLAGEEIVHGLNLSEGAVGRDATILFLFG
jgi:hypothetical protein